MSPGNQYSYRLAKMKSLFLSMADPAALSAGSDSSDSATTTPQHEWQLLASLPSPSLSVYKRTDTDFCIKVVADLHCTPETAFDMLADVTRRGDWDDLCEETGVVEVVDRASRVQFVKTKGVWPASPRDTLVLAYVEKLPDGRFLNVAQSVTHARFPPREADGIVRMEAKISGQLVGPKEGHPGMCTVIQINDADLKGWIPKSVIGFIATKSIPNSFKKLDQILATAESQTVSAMIARAQSSDEDADEESGGVLTNGPSSATPFTPNASNMLPVTVHVSPTAHVRKYPMARRLVRRVRAFIDWWNPFLIAVYIMAKAYKAARRVKA
ncbi:hypothetical protein BDZ88DRAFT_335454 [Geranomyces variabilis]|nr:hypothetical protein BDZ88DRAFT_335454 [Geranomyces variabilis]KAJ3131869.1 hypothetical protein HDU90_007698 [Geranomyces variabilis]